MAPSATDLTTIESFRQYQAVGGAAAEAMGERVEAVITVASEAIMDFCQRQFTPVADGVTYSFRYEGRGILSLAPHVAREITAVSVDGAASLAAEAYRLGPLPSRDATYTTLYLPELSSRESWVAVDVTGDWGHTEIPNVVREAANMTVGYILRTMSQYQGDEFDSVTTGWGGSPVLIPGNAKRLLAPYRQRLLGA